MVRLDSTKFLWVFRLSFDNSPNNNQRDSKKDTLQASLFNIHQTLEWEDVFIKPDFLTEIH